MSPQEQRLCWRAAFWGALAAALLAGCGGQSGPPPGTVPRYGPAPKESYQPKIGRHGGQIVFGSFGDGLKSLNPITAGETSTTDYTARIYEPLVDTDVWTQEIKPWLARSWEHGDDYLVWTFHLRDDVQFNDGTPFTADDVVFTFQVIYDETITCSDRDIVTVDGQKWKVEKVDDHTVRFTLPSPFAIFLDVLSAVRIISRRTCEAAYRAGTFNSFAGADATPEQVVGTGPFMLDRYTPGQRLYLKRNPHYWIRDAAGHRLPYLDRMVFTWVQSIDAWMLQFKTGQIDGYALRGVDYPVLKPLEKQGDFRIYELGTAMATAFVAFNQNPGVSSETRRPYIEPHKVKWFRDVRFRRAVAHAIDRQNIIRTVLNGLAVPQYGPMSPGEGYFYNDKVKPYPFDLDRAKQLLADMGLTDRDGDGFLEDAEGHKVQFTLMTNAGNTLREQIAEILRKDLANLGIQVDLKFIEFNLLVSKMDETFDWEAMVMSLTGGPEPHLGANVWKSSGRLHLWYPRQKQPGTPWEARIDEIYSLAVKEMDRAKRKVLYDEWQMIVNEQQPLVYTAVPMVLYGFKNKFDNVYPTVLAAYVRQETTWNIHEVFIREGYPLD